MEKFESSYDAVSKACHPALDAGSPEKILLIIRGLRVKPAMTGWVRGLRVDPESSSERNDMIKNELRIKPAV